MPENVFVPLKCPKCGHEFADQRRIDAGLSGGAKGGFKAASGMSVSARRKRAKAAAAARWAKKP